MVSERAIRQYFTTPNILAALSSILVNSYLIYKLWKSKKLHSISYKLVAILSASDVCVGFALLAVEIFHRIVQDGEDYFILRACIGIFLDNSCQFSGFMILLIAVDRYIHMKYPRQYIAIMTNSKAVAAVSMSMITSLCLTAIFLWALVKDFMFIYFLTVSIVAILVMHVLSILYIRAYRTVRNQTKPLILNNSSLQPVTVIRRDPNREFCRVVLYILAALWICHLPFIITAPMKHHARFKNEQNMIVCFFYSELLVFINSSLNAVLFTYFGNQFNSKRLLRFPCC